MDGEGWWRRNWIEVEMGFQEQRNTWREVIMLVDDERQRMRRKKQGVRRTMKGVEGEMVEMEGKEGLGDRRSETHLGTL